VNRKLRTKKVAKEIAERFEAALDYVDALDAVPFYVKREAAELAAQTALAYLQAAT
jgi:ribosomal protein S17E